MPTPFMCHDCDGYTMNTHGICDDCIEPTTADEYNKELFMKDASPHDPGDENDNKEVAYLEGEKNPLEAMEQVESKLEEMREDLLWATKEIERLRGGLHMCKELAMLRDNYGMIESIAEEHLNDKK